MSIASWPCAAAALLALAVPAEADPIAVTEKPGHVTEATVTIAATPEQIYDLVTDYAHWTSVLRDITAADVMSGGRRDAKVRFLSRILEHEIMIQFDNRENRTIHFVGIHAPPGAHASGTYTLQPTAGGASTQVTATLYLDVTGVLGVFVHESKLRAMRQAKLRSDLGDVQRWFEAHHPPK